MDRRKKIDNRTVFRYLFASVLGEQYEVYIKDHIATKDGRGAFQALDTYFNGGAYGITKTKSAWHIIQNTKYNGKKSALDFSGYRKILDEAWADLKEAGQDIPSVTKVTWLLPGMERVELETAKSLITDDEYAFRDYDSACARLSRLIANDEALDRGAKARQVASVELGVNSNGRVPSEQWSKMTPQEKDRVRESRSLTRTSDNSGRTTSGKSGRTYGRGRSSVRGRGRSSRYVPGRYDGTGRGGLYGRIGRGRRVTFQPDSNTRSTNQVAIAAVAQDCEEECFYD